MEPTRIMIVEDESIVAMDLKNRLRNLGYEVPARTASGEAALDKVADVQPDLILMDIRLKGELDGIATTEAIRIQWDIPIIYLTAHADEATLKRAKATAPYGYLLKPFEEGTLHTTIEMALHRHRLEQELQANRRWLATTLSSIGDAVISTDLQGRVEFMNPVAEKITGWTQADALGQATEQVFHIINAKTRERCQSPIALALEKGITVELEDNTSLISKDGREIPIDDSAAPIQDEKGNVHGVVVVFRDITERKQAEEQLRQFTAELQAKNAELDAFSRTVAHDLKSPLNPIVGFGSVLQESYHEMSDEMIADFLETIVRSGQKMSSIIDELLLLAQISKGDVPMQPLDMAWIVEEVQRRLSYMIEEKGGTIEVAHEWLEASGYQPWIEEIWVNYVSNGLKYGGTPPKLKLGSTRLSNAQICFWVQDNGPGLSAAEQARLFTPFTRLDEIRAKGHGLGLSIVQSIVTKLGGQVGVKCNGVAGQGCVFYFTLPAVQQAEPRLLGTLPETMSAASSLSG